jgi:hypothetical protein
MKKSKQLQLMRANNPVAAASSLADKKEIAKHLVDRQAGNARELYITETPGQQMVYQQKAEEALACKSVIDAAGTPDPDDYPHLVAEVGTTAEDLAGVTAIILARRALWIATSAEIEGLRSASKAAIDEATDEAGILAASTGIAWPKPE